MGTYGNADHASLIHSNLRMRGLAARSIRLATERHIKEGQVYRV